MKAIVRSSYGSTDVLELNEMPEPVPNDDQLLIRVRAASVNPLDWHLLQGKPFLVRLMGFGLFKPKHQVLGADIAGTVEAVGKNVTRFKPGDEVFGSGLGGFAEYACLRETGVLPKPSELSFEQVAAVPVAAVTALQALRDKGQLQPGQRVLINGASGGIGTFAVQLAKVLGAHVTGVCSGRNTDLVRSLGADEVIDYTVTKYWQAGEQYDLIVDNAAIASAGQTLRALKPGGILVPVGGSSSTGSILLSMITNPLIAMIKGKKIATFMSDMNQADLLYVKELLENKKLVPVIDRTYPLAETPQAIQQISGGHTRGKIVVVV